MLLVPCLEAAEPDGCIVDSVLTPLTYGISPHVTILDGKPFVVNPTIEFVAVLELVFICQGSVLADAADGAIYEISKSRVEAPAENE
jgi:hypothetical protein